MSQVRFAPQQGLIADYVLNHPTASPIQKNNISFRLGDKYLSDFSDKGIERFVKRNHNRSASSSRDLDFKEVGAFIQSVAQNAEQVRGATFDLADPELGLRKKDDVKAYHIRTRFTLDTNSGNLPSDGVVFFDATKAHFPLLDAEKALKSAQEGFENAEEHLEDKQDDWNDAKADRQSLIDFLGDDSQQILAEKTSQVSNFQEQLTSMESDRQAYQSELDALREEHKTQPANPPSGLDQEGRWKRMRQLRLALSGLGAEVKDTEKEMNAVSKSITSKQGPLSFMGIGNSLSELREDNETVANAFSKVQAAMERLEGARTTLNDAQSALDRIKNGEDYPRASDLIDPWANEAEQPAAQQPTTTHPDLIDPWANEPEQPVAQPQPEQQPTEPVQVQTPEQPVTQPVAQPEQPTQPAVAEEVVVPTESPTVQTQPQQPTQPAVAEEVVVPTEQPAVQAQPQQPGVETLAQLPTGPITEEELNWAQAFEAQVQQGYQPAEAEAAKYMNILERYQAAEQAQPATTEQPAVQAQQPAVDPFAPHNQFNPNVTVVDPNAAPAEEVIQPSTVDTNHAPVIEEPPSTAPVVGTPPTAAYRPYTVVGGDSLSKIAAKELGNANRWPEIHQLNTHVVGTYNKHLIFPGQILSLPRQ